MRLERRCGVRWGVRPGFALRKFVHIEVDFSVRELSWMAWK